MTSPLPYRTSSFAHAGYRLAYDDYGDEGDPPIVYMHGLLLDADLNRGIAEALAARGHRVVLLDLLGHGRSDMPTHASRYRIDSYAEQVFALLDHLGLDEAVLGGVSLGANVSLFAASQQPDRVRGLVLEMPVLEWAVPSAAMLFAPMLLVAHYARTPARWVASGVRRLPDTPFPALNSVIHILTSEPERTAAVLHGILVGPVAPTLEARGQISAPTLVLGHRNDLIHPFDDAENLVAQMPKARLLDVGSPLELRLRPDRLTGEIADFLDGVWKPRAVKPSKARSSRARSG